MTVGELIKRLESYDEDTVVYATCKDEFALGEINDVDEDDGSVLLMAIYLE